MVLQKIRTTTFYGGQAVMEGVMMKGTQNYAVAVRKSDGSIKVKSEPVSRLAERYKFLGWPFIRGIVNFFEMMVLGIGILTYSANEAVDGIEEEPSGFEKWLEKKLGKHFEKAVLGFSMVLGLLLAMGLFVVLPAGVVKLIGWLSGAELGMWNNLIEGVVKIGVFVAYIASCSCMRDIRRVFEYHGAEHKTIHCFEAGLELNVENAKKQSRLHPRCGTSFMLIVMVVSILVSSFVTWDNIWIRMLLKILLLPVVMGISYEILRLAGKYDNIVTRIISAPGLCLQLLSTKEPDNTMLEVAIAALTRVFELEHVEFTGGVHVPAEEEAAGEPEAAAAEE